MFIKKNIEALKIEIEHVLSKNYKNRTEIRKELDGECIKNIISSIIPNSLITTVKGNKNIGTYSIKYENSFEVIEMITHDINKGTCSNTLALSKLRKFYKPNSNHNYIYIMRINYDSKFEIPVSVEIELLENISFTKLTLSNIGSGGQLQLSQQDIKHEFLGTRDDWMQIFYQKLNENYYPNICNKINNEILPQCRLEQQEWIIKNPINRAS